MIPRLSRLPLLLVALASVSVPASGQGAERAPVELRSVPVVGPDAATVADSAALRVPVWISGRWSIGAFFGGWIPDSLLTPQIAGTMAECGIESGLNAGNVNLLLANPWTSFDSAAAAKHLVSFSVTPQTGSVSDCGNRFMRSAVAVRRGVRLPIAGDQVDESPLASVTLMIGDGVARPVYLGLAPVIQAERPGVEIATQVRFYVPLNDLAVGADGRFPRVSMLISTRDPSQSDSVVVADTLLRSVWNQALPFRLSLAGVPAIEATRNSVDRAIARATGAQRLMAAGDSGSARFLLSLAVADQPCLSTDETVPASFRAVLEPIRRPARCTTLSLPRTLMAAALAPGNGQRVTGRRNVGVPFAAGTLAAGGYAVWMWHKSSVAYKAYEDATDLFTVRNMWKSATTRRASAQSAATLAASIWVSSAIEATLAERRHTRRMARVRPYGAP